jgi:hypothetical protein
MRRIDKGQMSLAHKRVEAWNKQHENVRKQKLGLHRGASMFEAHQRLPFALPKKHQIRPDGSIGPRASRPSLRGRIEAARKHRGLIGSAVHAVEHAAESAVDYVSNYSPLRKDLPKEKPKQRRR